MFQVLPFFQWCLWYSCYWLHFTYLRPCFGVFWPIKGVCGISSTYTEWYNVSEVLSRWKLTGTRWCGRVSPGDAWELLSTRRALFGAEGMGVPCTLQWFFVYELFLWFSNSLIQSNTHTKKTPRTHRFWPLQSQVHHGNVAWRGKPGSCSQAARGRPQRDVWVCRAEGWSPDLPQLCQHQENQHQSQGRECSVTRPCHVALWWRRR